MALDIGLTITGFNNASGALRGASSDVKKLGDNAQATSNRLKAIQVVIAGILLNKTLEYGKALVGMAADMQAVDTRMAAFAGGIANTNAIQQKWLDTIGAAPVKLDTMTNAFIKFRTAGLDNGKASGLVDAMVKSLAAVGEGDIDSKLTNISTAFERLAAKGRVQSRDLNTIIQGTGITVKEMADQMGISVDKFYDDLQKKLTGASTFVDAFQKVAEEKFGGFVGILGSTVGGSLNKFKNDVDNAFGNLGQNTDVLQILAQVISQVDAAVVGFINNIKQDDVDNFFKVLQDMVPVAENIATIFIKVGAALLNLADVSAQFLNAMPADAVEYGIVGYVLLGKKGALLLGIVGALKNKLAEMKSIDMFGNKIDPDKEIKSRFGSNAHAGGVLDGIVGPQSQRKAVTINIDFKKARADFAAFMKSLNDPKNQIHTSPVGNQPAVDKSLEAQIEKAARVKQDVMSLLNDTGGKIDLLNFQTNGDELGATLQGLNNQTDKWTEALEAARLKIEQTKGLSTELRDQLLTKIGQEEWDIVTALQAAVDKQIELNRLKQEQIVLGQRALQAQTAETTRQLGQTQAGLSNPATAAYQGTSAYKAEEQAAAQVAQYQQQILSAQQQINGLKTSIANDPQNTNVYESSIQGLQTMIDKTNELSQTTSASTIAAQQAYQQLGSILENDVSDGITGLITGQETLGDVARKIVIDMISGLVKYMVQMIEMQIFGEAAQAASLAITAPIAAATALMWQPAAMAASIASYGTAAAVGEAAYATAMASSLMPFAQGGVPSLSSMSGSVLRGPTVFGLAGEAGDEGILPLTRVGGKLGVHASGMGGNGGNHYHITVQAIDTVSGLDFIGQHIGTIDAGLAHRSMTNRRRS